MNIHHDILTRDLKKHTQALALPLGRKVGSPGHEVTREYLLDRMKKMHLIPFRGDSFELGYERPHPNTKQPQKFTNLVGVIPGKDRSLPPILVGAHYDSVIDSPFDTEMRMLRKAIGPALPLAMKYFKIPMPKSRQELNGLLDEKLHGIPHKPE